MVEIAICDDNPLLFKDYYRRLSQTIAGMDYRVHCYETPKQMLDASNDDIKPFFDLAILDIEFGCEDMDGIGLAQKINILYPRCQIIFITGFVRYVSHVYDAKHIFFVLKDQMDFFFERAVKKALDNRKSTLSEHIYIKSNADKLMLRLSNITFMEREKHSTFIYLCAESGRVTTYERLDDIYKRLPQTSFVRCHKSYIVNLMFVKEFRRTEFILENGTFVPISRSNYEQVKRIFAKYVEETL